MTNRSQMSSITSPLGLERPDLFALELGTVFELDLVYTLSSTNINHSAPDFVKIYMTIRSRASSNYGHNWTQTTRVICPSITVAVFDLIFTVSIYMPI